MTEASSTPDSQAPTVTPQQIPTPQVTVTPPQQQPSPQPSTGNGPGTGQQLLDEIRALPEKLTLSLREALQPAKPPASQQNPPASAQSATAANSQQSSNSQPNKPGSESTKDEHPVPGKKTFAEWWFGK